jgi:hypothetical protein
MPVLINGSAITPAPNVTYTKNYIRTPGDGIIGVSYDIQLAGTIIAYKGNPDPSGISADSVYTSYSQTDDPISSISDSGLLLTIMNKQAALRSLLSTSPVALSITGFDGGVGISANCEIENIAFDDKSLWTTTCGYTINLNTPSIGEQSFTYAISEASEEWGISESDEYTASINSYTDQNKTYKITHNVSAIGQRLNGGSAFDEAKGYVTSVIGLGDTNLPTSLLPIAGGSVYNRKVVETSNVIGGSYSIQEEFTIAGNLVLATETVSVTVDNDISAVSKIQVQGLITGLNTLSFDTGSVDKYANAASYWTRRSSLIYDIANAYKSGTCDLNTVALSTSIGRNLTEGTISYNYSYDNRPSNFITSALSENIEIVDTYPGQDFNVIPVIGRSQPIIQYVNSRSAYRRSMQVSIQMPFENCIAVKPTNAQMSVIYEMYKPAGVKVYYSAPTENWNPKTGAYSYTIEWTFEGP